MGNTLSKDLFSLL